MQEDNVVPNGSDSPTDNGNVQVNSENSAPQTETNGQNGTEQKSVLEYVKSRVEATKEPEAVQNEVAEDEAAVDEEKVDSPEDDEKLPFHKHPRWQKITAENKELKSKLADVEVLTDKSSKYDGMVEYFKQTGLNAEDLDFGVSFVASLKNNPEEALKTVENIYRSLREQAGLDLPEDLLERVENGFDTEETVRELARERAQSKAIEAKLKQEQERRARELEEMERQNRARTDAEISNVVNAIEAEWSKTDPDFAFKAEYIANIVRAEVATNGKPNNREEAILMLREAKEKADAYIKRITPKNTQPKAPNLTTPTNVQHDVRPKSALEAARASLQNMNRI